MPFYIESAARGWETLAGAKIPNYMATNLTEPSPRVNFIFCVIGKDPEQNCFE